MGGWVDVRDDDGTLLFRYNPITGEVEVLIHRYDRDTRKHRREKRVAKLPAPAPQVDKPMAAVV